MQTSINHIHGCQSVIKNYKKHHYRDFFANKADDRGKPFFIRNNFYTRYPNDKRTFFLNLLINSLINELF